MKNFKTIIIFFLLLIFLNQTSFASNKIKIIAKVGNEIITSVQLENKIKITLFLAGDELNQKNINNIKNLSLQNLINVKLKKEELKKYKVDKNKINQDRLNNYLKKVAFKMNIAVNEIENIFAMNKINYNQFLDELKIEFLWQNLIFQLYKKNIDLNDTQIIAELNKTIKNQTIIQEYHLAEIELNNSNAIKISDVEKYINNFGFEKAAIRFSVSESAINGGDIGWVNAKILSAKVNDIVKNLKIGNISNFIQSGDTIIFLKLLNKKNVSNLNELDVENLKKSIINKQTNELLSMYSNNHLSLKKNSTLIELK
jgi:peptidyl-prolyl cis-trans isomerase SurA